MTSVDGNPEDGDPLCLDRNLGKPSAATSTIAEKHNVNATASAEILRPFSPNWKPNSSNQLCRRRKKAGLE